ncbi:uncharacterized protein N7496_001676 [Penicillium cataractarum]|uniref:NB-ARC domain-containing protein n=1 Tax=Penicillium cataractarum TaxID=2100454 RepID=A0A9W9VWH2_9EURO|nr:uncharacterized protein N7496_001676 [Penicillium cataractarum]KAJ5390608.1 hypothetical protein N7496_001676 [Penicillium cataractarum]
MMQHLIGLMQHPRIGKEYPTSSDQLFAPDYIHKHHTGCIECSLAESVCDTALNASCEELECDQDMLVQRVRRSGRDGRCALFQNIPYQRNKGYIVRDGQLAELEHRLFSPGQQRKVALTGLGGVGKTQDAIELAHRLQLTQPELSIFWIPATTSESLQEAYFDIAQKLRFPELEEGADPKKLLQNYLGDKNAGQWLLIFDDAEDIDLWYGKSLGNTGLYGLSDYLPWSPTGSILFTTRSKKLASKLAMQNTIEIREMDDVKAKELFAMRLHDKDLLREETEIALLLKQLVFLPLAIVQAASYINENTITSVAEYRYLLTQPEEKIVDLVSENETHWRSRGIANAVATTWLVSFERIYRLNRLAIDILSFMACVQPTAIPESLLPPAPSRMAWVEAIGILRGYSFVTKRSTEQGFDLHRLVHLAMRSWLRKNGNLLTQTVTTLARLVEVFPNDDHTNRALWKACLPHALNVVHKDEVQNMPKRYELLFKVSLCLLADGRTTEAIEYLTDLNDWQKSPYDQHHPFILASQHELARAYLVNGRARNAVELLERVVAIEGETLAEEHPSLLGSQYTLAAAYRANTQIPEAVKLLRHVVAVKLRTGSQQDLSLLASQQELAGACAANGEIQEVMELLEHIKQAVKLLEYVVTLQEGTLAPEQPSLLASQHELAVAYRADGQIKKALELLERVVKIKEETLNEAHLSFLASQYELAETRAANEQIIEAIELFEDVVTVQKRTLARGHHFRIKAQHELAAAYRVNGQIKEAVEVLEHVVAIEVENLADEHPNQLTSQYLLAGAYRANEQIGEAANVFQQIIAVEQRALAEGHPSQMASQDAVCIF